MFIGSEAPKWNFGQSLVQCPPTSLAGGTTSRLITWHGGGAGGLACSTHVEARPRDATALIGRSEGHPGRSALPIAAVGLEGSCLGPYESDVPAEAQWWCIDLLGRAGRGVCRPPGASSIAQYRPVSPSICAEGELTGPREPSCTSQQVFALMRALRARAGI